MEDALNDCRCGGKAELYPVVIWGGLNYAVKCNTCDAQGDIDCAPHTAKENWQNGYINKPQQREE